MRGFICRTGNQYSWNPALQNIHGRQGYDRAENRLTMNYVRVRRSVARVRTSGVVKLISALTYDNDHPEAGPVVETREAK